MHIYTLFSIQQGHQQLLTQGKEMGKNKKHRVKKNKDNNAEESSDDAIPSCPHIAKAINFAAMRKAVVKSSSPIGECTSCALESSKGPGRGRSDNKTPVVMSDTGGLESHAPSVCVCLQCGHQGCDRYSQETHAVKHYETLHSGIHCLVINLTTWVAWCYACDNEVPLENRRVQECVDFLYKQSGKAAPSAGASQSTKENADQNELPTNAATDIPLSSSSPATAPPVVITPQAASSKASDIICQKVKGLNNLGNTCFFNAVMQSLCQTWGLEKVLMERCGTKDLSLHVGGWKDTCGDSESGSQSDSEGSDQCSRLPELSPISIALGEPGPLSASLLSFVREMSTMNGKNTVSPSNLFSNICKKAPRFKGYQQQDSHELLRYLIDVVRSEEIKRAQLGILRHFKLPEKPDPKTVDEDVRKKIKDYGRQVKFTFVDSLFGGQLVSTITCEECSHVSQIVESFLDLSLSVTEEKPQRPNQMLGGRHKESPPISAGVGRGDEEEERPLLKGVDGFAEGCGKTSKYQERKNRKQAKKDAKRKGKNTKQQTDNKKSNARDEDRELEKAEDKEEEENVDKEHEGGDDDSHAHLLTRKNEKKDDDEQNSQEETSDADVEDNLDNEVTAVMGQTSAGGDNTQSNLTTTTTTTHSPYLHMVDNKVEQPSNLMCDDDRDCLVDLTIKSGTQKEKHILPPTYLQSGHAQCRTSSDRESTGIKEKPCEIEKLASDFCGLSLHDSGLGRTEVWSDELSTTGHGGKDRDTGTDVSFSSPDLCCSSMRDSVAQPAQNWGTDYSRRVNNWYVDPALAADDDLACFKNDDVKSQQTSSMDENFSEQLVFPSDNVESASKSKERHIEDAWVGFYKEAQHKSKSTLAPRYQPSSKECSVMSCLNQFTSAELLTGPNKVRCKECAKKRAASAKTSHNADKEVQSVYTNASKQYLILIPPAVLTLHFKRFEQVGFAFRKVNRHVDFPPLLDLAPYCSTLCQEVRRGQGRVLYSLYGVVEHSGRLQGGHYTAYVKVRPGIEPCNKFLRSHLPQPYDFIHKYIDQLSSGSGDSVTTTVPEDSETLATAADTVTVPAGRWFHVSDSSVTSVNESKVFSAQAYLLFYERIE